MNNIVNSVLKLLIVFLTGWTLYISVSAFFDITIYFPFKISEAEFIPYHRWQTVRIAVFLTFSYYAILHLFNKEKEYPPIQFLAIYIKILTIVGCIIFYKAGVPNSEYFVVLFFGLSSVILHLSCRTKYRKYFTKKGKGGF